MWGLVNSQLFGWLGFMLRNVDPGLVYLVAGFGGIFALVGTHPVRVTDEKKIIDLALIHIRQLLLLASAIVFVLVMFITFYVSRKLYGNYEYWNTFAASAKEALLDSWPIIPMCWLIAWLTAYVHHRIVTPYLSHLSRRFRIRQSGDELSDIRVERLKLKSKNYNPASFYKAGFMFLGLDDAGKPIYVTDADFITRNMKVIGPTQTGKGVVMGIIIDQAIRKGWTTIFVNPKPDKFIPNIMRESCAASNRRAPIQLDLNGVGPGKYGPFVSGTSRQRRERLLWATGLNDDGNQADFYKAAERSIVDQLLPRWDGSLSHLNELLHPKKSADVDSVKTNTDIFKKTERLRSYVTEWLSHTPLSAPADRGFNLALTIRENGVAHIVSNTRDKLVKAATTVLLMDLIQSVEALGNDPRKHILVVVDEVKFMISDTLAAGLATVLDKGCNMVIAYQTINDLQSLEDKKLNAKVIQQAVEVNCKYTLCYRAEDTETAEWAALKSGEVNKKVATMEKVEQNRMGAEHWAPDRTLRSEKENLIPVNKFLSLPERVAGFFSPDHNARLLYTCWVPVKEMRLAVEPKSKKPAPSPVENTSSAVAIHSAPTPATESKTSAQIEPTIGDGDLADIVIDSPAPVENNAVLDAKKAELREKLHQLDTKPKVSTPKPTIDASAALDELLSAAKVPKIENIAAAKTSEHKENSARGDVNNLNDDLANL